MSWSPRPTWPTRSFWIPKVDGGSFIYQTYKNSRWYNRYPNSSCWWGGGGGGFGTSYDVGGGGGSGSYVDVYLNHTTFKPVKSGNTHIYVTIGRGGANGIVRWRGSDGGNTVIKFSNGENTQTIISTVPKGLGGLGGGLGEITTGIGYSIPGRNGQNGLDHSDTAKMYHRTGTRGGDSNLGRGGKSATRVAGNKFEEPDNPGIRGGGGGGGGGVEGVVTETELQAEMGMLLLLFIRIQKVK